MNSARRLALVVATAVAVPSLLVATGGVALWASLEPAERQALEGALAPRAGAVYLDWAATYKMLLGANQDTRVELFFNVKNLANKDPVIAVGGPGGVPYDTVSTNSSVYDSLGRVYRAGFRVKM